MNNYCADENFSKIRYEHFIMKYEHRTNHDKKIFEINSHLLVLKEFEHLQLKNEEYKQQQDLKQKYDSLKCTQQHNSPNNYLNDEYIKEKNDIKLMFEKKYKEVDKEHEIIKQNKHKEQLDLFYDDNLKLSCEQYKEIKSYMNIQS